MSTIFLYFHDMNAANDDTIVDKTSSQEKRIITPNHVRLAFSLASSMAFATATFLVLTTNHRLLGVGCFLLSNILGGCSTWIKGSLATYQHMEKEQKNTNLNEQLNESSERLREATQRANSVLLRSKFTFPWHLKN